MYLPYFFVCFLLPIVIAHISLFVSYHQLSSPTYSFITSLDSTSILNIVHETFSHLGWLNAMIEEINALHDNGTWDLVSPLARK